MVSVIFVLASLPVGNRQTSINCLPAQEEVLARIAVIWIYARTPEILANAPKGWLGMR